MTSHAPMLRVLIVLPSWVGDVVMATPTLRFIRSRLPGAFLGGLVRPGLDELLAGTDFLDELHVDRARGMMGPKHVAAKLRPRRYDTALLLTNSFSTALITRLAFIPRRIGYDRDARGVLLTDRLQAPRRERPHRGFAPISAVQYYLEAANTLFAGRETPADLPPFTPRLELAATQAQEQAATTILQRANITTPFAILNPGGNNPAKRWPAERFAMIARHLIDRHNLAILINGSPNESDLVRSIALSIPNPDRPLVPLPDMGITLGALKSICRRASLMVTNDTGPRHIAAAFSVPTVAMFGPTDPRWTTLPDAAAFTGESLSTATPPRELVLVADPSLPPEEVADDHPDRCAIEKITTDQVMSAVDRLLAIHSDR